MISKLTHDILLLRVRMGLLSFWLILDDLQHFGVTIDPKFDRNLNARLWQLHCFYGIVMEILKSNVIFKLISCFLHPEKRFKVESA